MLRSTCLVAMVAVLATGSALPVEAHVMDVRSAADGVSAAAAQLGPVRSAECWRPVVGRRQAHHRAVCVARIAGTTSKGDCFVFYEVRMAGAPDRPLRVIELFQPWC
jgi:hypothetical protein